MNALRLLLLALGGLFAVGACFVVVGFIVAAFEEEAFPDGDICLGLLVFEVVLALPAIGLFYLAHRITRRQRRLAKDAAESGETIEVLCPRCNCAAVVQGPQDTDLLFRKSYIARCLSCGHRSKVVYESWRGLPLPEGGDAYETASDRKHLMTRLPMTAGQVVFVVVGVIAAFIAMFLLLEGYEDRVASTVLSFTFLPIAYGAWRLGRFVFPPRRIIAERCGNCGYDLRSSTEACCPRCGAPFEGKTMDAD